MLTASSVSVLASSSLSEATPSSVSTASLLSKAAAESSASSTGKSNQFQVLTLVSMGSKGNRSQIGQPATRNRTSSVHESIDSGLSTKVSNPGFYVTPPHPANLSQSQTWKSDEAKQRDQFDRRKILLQHFAPEQFKPRAKPANEPANIVPQTYLQYQIHKKELEAEEMLNKIAFLEAKKARSNLEPIRQAFNGKVFKSGRSSVLSQLTIWSDNFEPTYEHPQIAWPDRDQLHEDGEKRENKFTPTRCGRFLPALPLPRHRCLHAAVSSRPSWSSSQPRSNSSSVQARERSNGFRQGIRGKGNRMSRPGADGRAWTSTATIRARVACSAAVRKGTRVWPVLPLLRRNFHLLR